MIYFLTYESLPGYVKIGFSENEDTLYNRINQYSTYNPLPVVVLKTMEGTVTDERELHVAFADYRVSKRGEWFYLTTELRKFIDSDKPIKPDAPDEELPTYVYQKRKGNIYHFFRRVPKKLQMFSRTQKKMDETQWWIPLHHDLVVAKKLAAKYTADTQAWIDKHTEIYRQSFV